jgi:hypothetical protein
VHAPSCSSVAAAVALLDASLNWGQARRLGLGLPLQQVGGLGGVQRVGG